jgi:hypothetical protein
MIYILLSTKFLLFYTISFSDQLNADELLYFVFDWFSLNSINWTNTTELKPSDEIRSRIEIWIMTAVLTLILKIVQILNCFDTDETYYTCWWYREMVVYINKPTHLQLKSRKRSILEDISFTRFIIRLFSLNALSARSLLKIGQTSSLQSNAMIINTNEDSSDHYLITQKHLCHNSIAQYHQHRLREWNDLKWAMSVIKWDFISRV